MARSKSKNIGLIGLGIIGTRVAATLRKRGFRVFVWNRTPRPEQNFLGSPVEVAELCDLVQIFVADDDALLATVQQLSPGLTAQHIVAAHCTVAPESMRAAAEVVQRRGARFLEAPFTGSKVAAGNGELVYYIAGDDAALKQARPMLEASSKEIIVISDRIGDASILKVATNIVTAATAQVGAEALALVRKAGITTELFARAMKFNASNSATMEMKLPLMEAGNYETHFSVKHMHKDVRIASKLAENYSLKLPVTEVSGDMLLEEMKRGHGDADYSSVAQRYFPARDPLAKPAEQAPSPPPAPAAAKLDEKPPTPLPPAASLPNQKPKVSVLPSAPRTVERVPLVPPPEEQPKRAEAAQEPVAAKSKNESNPATDDADEGVNLSGGFRGWLSRRAKRPEPKKDAGAV